MTYPGPVCAQPFAQDFDFSASPANRGGNNYAYGGARVTAGRGDGNYWAVTVGLRMPL